MFLAVVAPNCRLVSRDQRGCDRPTCEKWQSVSRSCWWAAGRWDSSSRPL